MNALDIHPKQSGSEESLIRQVARAWRVAQHRGLIRALDTPLGSGSEMGRRPNTPRGDHPVPPIAPIAPNDRYTVAGLIRHLAQTQPDHEMLVAGEVRRTWAEEYQQACRVAQACRRDGVEVGDRLAFLDRNGVAYFDVLFGGAFLGAVNVAVNWRLAGRRRWPPSLRTPPPAFWWCTRITCRRWRRWGASCRPCAGLWWSAMTPPRPRVPMHGPSPMTSGWRDVSRSIPAMWVPPVTSACSCTPRAPPDCPRV